MLGLRLDELLAIDDEAIAEVVDCDALGRLVDRELVEAAAGGVRLTPRGRLLGGAVTAELLA
jgi:hypothetical protein